ncbi:MAG: hypothetical protein ACREQW_17560 [Candidatus Binatia bacterium]
MDSPTTRITDQNPRRLRLLLFAVLFACFVWACVAATEVMSLRLERFWTV